MPYLIDGHNLIPKIPGLSLQALDDEMQLVTLLQQYCQRTSRRVEIYFDNAPAGHAGTRAFGTVKAHFVPRGRTADDAIRLRLERLGRAARNWHVVSSDRQVQAEARALGAARVGADQFARELVEVLARTDSAPQPEPELSEQELQDWLTLFGEDDYESDSY